ncbi:hypothetical protein U6A24_13630 [Aquimarina gracilis]|uniref:Uncharacterized protein n=1 Tax=Aquimarina gracilis TaxID=874422 RepID=A0ABU5ZXD5_9FLAO|nr:hypothetical protein [Aquimarina gracilis]MEB3346513.1 hypothetical protein [Aquimarina gracilis]
MESRNRIYEIDYNKMVVDLLPIVGRKVAHVQWLRLLVYPLYELLFTFKKFRKQAAYKVFHNGQVVYLQKVLNDSYDKDLRRIKIIGGSFTNYTFVYEEQREEYLFVDSNTPNEGGVFIYDGSAFETRDVSFVVLVPKNIAPENEVALNSFILRMKALIDYYRIASKTYKIQWIE